MGEQDLHAVNPSSRVAVDTIAGRIHVEWDPDAAVAPMAQLPFFIEFLKVSGLYDAFVADCPLRYTSPNAPEVKDVLDTMLLSILAGHKRYAHITTIRSDRVNPCGFLKELACTAEQLCFVERVKLIARRAFRKLLASPLPFPSLKLLQATG